jgi:hypothetical protein
MKRTDLWTIVVVLSLMFGVTTAEAQGGSSGNCSVRTLKGRFAATISGWFGSGPTRVPYGATGSIYLDGRGNIDGAATQSLDGVISSSIPVQGTYTVDPETCTGNATSTIGTFFFSIVKNGEGTLIVGTTAGTTVTGYSTRQ